MFKHIFAIAQKDLRIFFADRRSMIISFVVPIMIATFFSFVMVGSGGGSKAASKIGILVVNEDNDPLTKSLIDKLGKSDMISVETVTRTVATEKVQKGDKSVAVIFPKGFADKAKRALFAGQPADLEELYDPTKGTDRQVVQGALMQTLMEEISKSAMSGEGAKSGLQAAANNETDPERKKAWQGFLASWETLDKAGVMSGAGGAASGGMRQPFQIKGSAMTASKDQDADVNAGRAHVFGGMAVQGLLFLAIESAMGILRDRRLGVWARMKAAPVSSSSIVLGKGLGAWVQSLCVFAGVMAFGIAAIHVRVFGSWIGLLLVAAAIACMTASYGLLVASLGKTEAQSRGFSMLAVMVMLMVGGAWFPTFLMPQFMQTLSKAIPVRWAIDGVDAMVFRGAGIADALVPIGVLLGFTAVFSTIAIVRLKRL